MALSVIDSPATRRASAKCGNAAAHVAASVVSTRFAPMKHSSLAVAGLSSTFCESGTFRVSASMFDSQLSIVRNDLSAIDGGGVMLEGTSAAFHVQINWLPCPPLAASSLARITYEW